MCTEREKASLAFYSIGLLMHYRPSSKIAATVPEQNHSGSDLESDRTSAVAGFRSNSTESLSVFDGSTDSSRICRHIARYVLGCRCAAQHVLSRSAVFFVWTHCFEKTNITKNKKKNKKGTTTVATELKVSKFVWVFLEVSVMKVDVECPWHFFVLCLHSFIWFRPFAHA